MIQIASCNLLEVCFRINYFEVTVACLLLKRLRLQTLTLLPRSSGNYILSAVQANYIHCTHWSYLCLNLSRGNIEEDKDTHQMGRVGVAREISLWRQRLKSQCEAFLQQFLQRG